MRKLSFAAAIAGGLLAGPAAADMYQDGSNSADAVTLKTLTVNKTLVYPNEPRTRIFGTGISTGTTTGADINAAYKFNVDADNANCLSAAGCYNTYVGHSFGGPALQGHRTGLGIFTNLTAPTGNTTGTHWYTALGATSVGSASDGGTPVAPRGSVFAANFIAQLTSAATNMNELVGLEVDTVADAGSSVAYKTGIKIVQYAGSNVRGSVEDVAFSLTNGYSGAPAGPAPGWLYGISFGGRQGAWPMATTGTLMGTNPTGDPGPYATANGIDFSAVTFSGSAFKSPGFSVDGAGAARTTGLSVEDTRPLAAGIGGAVALKAVNGAGVQVSYAGIRSHASGGTPGSEGGNLMVQAMVAGTLTDTAQFDSLGGFAARRGIMSGSLTPLSLVDGEIGMARMIAGASAPGAAGGKLAIICGTNAGTAKLVMFAGTSPTPVTVIDNIGAGVAGC